MFESIPVEKQGKKHKQQSNRERKQSEYSRDDVRFAEENEHVT
jgi:hypothetical protein